MSEASRRAVVRGAAWSVPAVTMTVQAPAFAASTDAPGPNGMVPVCRTTGQGGGQCPGYKVVLNFLVSAPYSWDITITTAQIVADAGPTSEIRSPASFPQTISSTSNTLGLWFCTGASPSRLRLQVGYTARRTDLPSSTPVSGTFPQQLLTNIPNNCP